MYNFKQYLFLLLLTSFFYSETIAQKIPDTLAKQYIAMKTDIERRKLMGGYIFSIRNDTAFLAKASEVLKYLSDKSDPVILDYVQLSINDALAKTGDYVTALTSSLDILRRFVERQNKHGIMAAYRTLCAAYYYSGDKERDIEYGKKAMAIAREINSTSNLSGIANNIATSYAQHNMPDSALAYAFLSVRFAREQKAQYDLASALGTLAEAFISNKEYTLAIPHLRESLAFSEGIDNLGDVWCYNDFSVIYLETNVQDSARYYAHKAIELSTTNGYKDQLQRAYEYLSRSFEKDKINDSAYKYLQLAVSVKDSLHTSDKARQLKAIDSREQSRLQEEEKANIQFKNKMTMYGLLTGLGIFAIIAVLLYRNNRQKQQANIVLESTLSKLKATQTQLIQSEKMASLGELTAGIAHEIQNPLNFVNNFSEVNTELIEEMQNERSKVKSERNEQLQDELLNNIAENEKKINHHGKRADAIVKGMLQHSRSSSGQKEPTDINALADEYLRLAYHGLRARDNSFNATMKTDFDKSIKMINIVPQDIGRVILNLITNAFYAVGERSSAKAEVDKYEPTVSVGTVRVNGKIEIMVKDNGNGIPPKILDKIFQPFFTTKPTGQGTGLGLSLSYDIVKAHGGDLRVESVEGKGSEFIIDLPIKS
jgi:signal transduction histidine kinase